MSDQDGPGVVQTPVHLPESYDGLGGRISPLGRAGRVSDVVDGVLFLESSPYITGERLGVGEITIAAHADGPPQHRHARLNTFTPDLYAQYFRDLRDMIAAGQPMTPDNAGAVMSRYGTVPATDFAEETP